MVKELKEYYESLDDEDRKITKVKNPYSKPAVLYFTTSGDCYNVKPPVFCLRGDGSYVKIPTDCDHIVMNPNEELSYFGNRLVNHGIALPIPDGYEYDQELSILKAKRRFKLNNYVPVTCIDIKSKNLIHCAIVNYEQVEYFVELMGDIKVRKYNIHNIPYLVVDVNNYMKSYFKWYWDNRAKFAISCEKKPLTNCDNILTYDEYIDYIKEGKLSLEDTNITYHLWGIDNINQLIVSLLMEYPLRAHLNLSFGEWSYCDDKVYNSLVSHNSHCSRYLYFLPREIINLKYLQIATSLYPKVTVSAQYPFTPPKGDVIAHIEDLTLCYNKLRKEVK